MGVYVGSIIAGRAKQWSSSCVEGLAVLRLDTKVSMAALYTAQSSNPNPTNTVSFLLLFTLERLAQNS